MKKVIEFILSVVIAIGVLIIALTASAYIGFGVGATIGMLAGPALSVSPALVAKMFAWAFVVLAVMGVSASAEVSLKTGDSE